MIILLPRCFFILIMQRPRVEGDQSFYGQVPNRLSEKKVEIDGLPIKAIASNVRRQDINWPTMKLVQDRGREGNLVVVKALGDTGSRTQVENQFGRDERMYKDDIFIGVLANRHSGTSESGDVPSEGIDITPDLELHLLAAGGIVGINTGIPHGMRQEPFRLQPLGLVATQEGKPLDLIELSGGHDETLNPSAPIVMVCGTSAEVGKTTTSTSLIRALREQGLGVAGTKFAGTGRMRDIMSLRDAGADPHTDFPDVGLATTYTDAERFTKGTYTLFNRINSGEPTPDIIVAEAGGDPIEANIPTFLRDKALMKNVGAVVIVSGDVMGMKGTVDYLRKFTDAPLFLTDPKGRNPVSTRERVRHELPGIPIFNSLNPAEVGNVARQITAN